MVDRCGVDPSQIGFIAFAWSKWHALGIEAFVHDLREKGDDRPGIVFLMPHPTEGMLVSEEDLILSRSDPFVRVMRSEEAPSRVSFTEGHISRLLLLIQSVFNRLKGMVYPSSRNLYLVTANFIPWGQLSAIGFGSVIRGYSLRVIYLDEGIGSYMPRVMWAQVLAKERLSSRLSGMKAIARRLGEGYYDLLYGAVNRLLGGEQRFLFIPSGDNSGLLPNGQMVDSYRAVLAAVQSPERQHDGVRVALVLTQPWSEQGHIASSDEIGLVRSIIVRLAEQGFSIILKPHPRETPGKYAHLLQELNNSIPQNLSVSSNALAAEMHMSGMGPDDVVVGYNSTALVTAATIYGIKAKAIDVESVVEAKGSKYFVDSMRLFLERFASLVSPL